MSQEFAADLGVRKEILTVPVRKPDKAWWVRTHPAEAYRLATLLLELKEEREIYLIHPRLWGELSTEATVSPKLLVTAITRQGVLFVWHIRLPGPDGRIDDWNRSSQQAADLARERWIRITANQSLGAYDVYRAPADLDDPQWPETSFNDLLEVAFRDHRIDTLDHPVLRRLRGEV